MPAPTDGLEGSSELLDQLLGDSKTREQTLRLIKQVKPDAVIPEIDVADGVRASLAADNKAQTEKLDKLEKTLLERDARDRLESQRRKVVADGYCSEEELTAVEKLIVDEGFPNYTAAAKYFHAQKLMAPPTADKYYTTPFKSLPDDFIKDATGAADKLAHEMVDQMNGTALLRH